MSDAPRWPALPLDAWRDTYATLHMWMQVVGKVCLALTPPTNHFWNIAFQITARGLTTPAMYADSRVLTMTFDFLDHQLVVQSSDGRTERIPLAPRTVAEFYRTVMETLRRLDVDVHIWPMPVEVPNPIRFDRDDVHRSYDAAAAQAFWRILVAIKPVLGEETKSSVKETVGKAFGDTFLHVRSLPEGDLPEMAARKRQALARMGALGDTHRVVELDALRDDGPGSLAAAAEELEAGDGLAIVTEGLLGYLPRDAVDGIWRGFAAALEAFSAGLYVSDVHIGAVQNVHTRAFRVLLSAFVRGRVHLHFDDPEDVCAALSDAGFTQCEVRAAGELAHILEASTT